MKNLDHIHLLVLALIVAAPNCYAGTSSPKLVTGAVTFGDSGASITPGEGWYFCKSPPGAVVFSRNGKACGPIIANDSGMLTVILKDKLHNNLDTMAGELRAECDSLPSADKQSFRRDAFVTDNGLPGLHVSYTQENVQPDGRKVITRCNHYLIVGPDRQGVDIVYLATANRATTSVFEMIRKTLKVK